MSRPRGFGSDNHAGALPEVLAAVAAANHGHAASYGHDAWTARMEQAFAAEFGPAARVFPVFNGTGANVMAARAACRPWEAVICTESAHMHVDECGAIERVAGRKLVTVAAADGKLTPAAVEARIVRVGDEHAVQPRVVSVTQPTELGTLYTRDELRALAGLAHERGLLLHVDGARLANAAVALGTGLAEAASGADVVSFGGTKAGLLFGEAVVFLRPELADGAPYLRKQTLMLASKQRFLAVQLGALLEQRLWRASAGRANAMAARLAERVGPIPGVTLTQPVQCNAVFAVLPPGAAERLQRDWAFYTWDEARHEVRWMCAWDTTEEDVDAFAADVGEVVSCLAR
jgi:threonine aldolase